MAQYSDEEEKFIEDNYYNLTYSEMSEKLNRTEGAIKSKANRMGLFEEDNDIRRRAKIIDSTIFDKAHMNYFISGFVSGEGSFSRESQRRSYKFEICVSSKDRELIEKIMQYFGNIGNIHSSERVAANEEMVTWQVSSASELAAVIIPFFEEVGMLESNKEKQYIEWKENFLDDYNISDIVENKSKDLSISSY